MRARLLARLGRLARIDCPGRPGELDRPVLGSLGGLPGRSNNSPKRFRVDFRSDFRVIFVRLRCACARATQKARHAFHTVKTDTKRMSAVPRATRKSRKIIRKSLRAWVRAQTTRKTSSESSPTRLGSIPGRSGSVPQCSGTPRECPGSVLGAPRGMSGASRERPRGAPNRPKIAPRAPGAIVD